MKRSTRIFSVLMVFVFAVTLSACEPDPNESFIQGTWHFANEFDVERSGSAHVFQIWQFRGGSFYFEFEVTYNFPDFAEGHYRIVESEGDTITIELYDVVGNANIAEGGQLDIILDRENELIRINRVLYERFGP